MKTIIILFILIFCFCAVGDKYDHQLGTLESGEIIELHYNIGDTYFIRSIDKNRIQRVIKLSNNMFDSTQ